jgi:hypothetical protein
MNSSVFVIPTKEESRVVRSRYSSFVGMTIVLETLALMEAASFCRMQWRKRYSAQQEHASEKRHKKTANLARGGFLFLVLQHFPVVIIKMIFKERVSVTRYDFYPFSVLQ